MLNDKCSAAPTSLFELFRNVQFSMTELETLEVNNTENPTAICKDHYYFFLNNDYLVTNLQGNKTIKNLQTYISWFIQDEFLELTPLVTASESIILSELKDIIVKDPDSVPNPKVVAKLYFLIKSEASLPKFF